MAIEKGILVIAEEHDGQLDEVSLELLSEGRRIADKLGEELSAILIGDKISGLADRLAHQGADIVYLVDNPLFTKYTAETAEAYSIVVSDLAQQQKPGIIICSSGVMGQDLAPRIAAKLKTGLVLDCIDLKLGEGGVLVQTKPTWGGNVYNAISSTIRPQICALRPGVAEISRPDKSRKAKIVNIEPPVKEGESRVKVIRSFKVKGEALSLTEADVIVSGGRGVGSSENWKLIEELGQVLGGTIAGSQGALDAGWITREKQVGLSGKTVTPKLYIACGISGAAHHVMGMKDSKNIVAINKDRGAPIFKLADISVLGNILDIAPALIRKLREIPKTGGEAKSA